MFAVKDFYVFHQGMAREMNKTTTGRLNNGVSQVPPSRGPSDLNAFRQTLPVSAMREDIVRSINENKVVLISGETGSGKTTQVRQLRIVSILFSITCLLMHMQRQDSLNYM